MIPEKLFYQLLFAWMALSVVLFPVLLRITVPYGRHTRNTWGPMVNNRLGWFLMELPVVIIFSWFFFHGNAVKSAPVYVFYGLFMLHYFNQIFIFPFRLRENGKQMPWLIVLLALFFNFSNGFFQWLLVRYAQSGLYYFVVLELAVYFRNHSVFHWDVHQHLL